MCLADFEMEYAHSKHGHGAALSKRESPLELINKHTRRLKWHAQANGVSHTQAGCVCFCLKADLAAKKMGKTAAVFPS